jgi:hypothetical protein
MFVGLMTAGFGLHPGTHPLLMRFKAWLRLRRALIRDRLGIPARAAGAGYLWCTSCKRYPAYLTTTVTS